jgi:hypothetical protein
MTKWQTVATPRGVEFRRHKRNIGRAIRGPAGLITYWPEQEKNGTVAFDQSPGWGAYPGAELLVDGDMEAVGVSAWTPNADAVLTKETTNPHGGSQVLRIARDGTNNPNARQVILEFGKRYRFNGYARSDGNAIPMINSGVYWTGTTST